MSNITHIEADIQRVDGDIAILVTRWNSFITDNLLAGALGALSRNNIEEGTKGSRIVIGVLIPVRL